jgi:probable F420-dependent oxidoreductase
VTTFSIGLPVGGRLFDGPDVPRLVEVGRLAENAGAAAVVMPDHVVIGPHTDRYAWGPFGFANDAPWLEPLTVLAAIAATTRTVRLATGILIAPLRPAVLLAKTAATLDVLSGGRLELGVGTGWQQEEFDAEGIDFAARGQLLTDTMAACRTLWRESPATFSSPTLSFEDIWCDPKPVQPGGPTVLFSGTLNTRNLRRITELGDGWIPIMGETPDGIATGVGRIAAAWKDRGRDPSALQVRTTLPIVRDSDRRPDLAASLRGISELTACGVTDVTLHLPAFVRDATELEDWFARLAELWAQRDD